MTSTLHPLALCALLALLPGCGLVSNAQAQGLPPCPAGVYTDAEYGFSVEFPAGYRCEFKQPSRTGQEPLRTVRVIAFDPRTPLCLAAISVIPQPDTSTQGGQILQSTLDGLISGGERRPDGSIVKHVGPKDIRTLAGGPPYRSARTGYLPVCDAPALQGMLDSFKALPAPAAP
ncbi:MAG: hypothetical protein ABIO70_13890 [Pseudomonadota bacterium]